MAVPTITIVGLADTAMQESRERVQTAVKNAGLHFPRHRIVVNLAPASVRKEGPSYDLPIALGVLILAGYLPQEVDAAEAALIPDLEIMPVRSLADLYQHLSGGKRSRRSRPRRKKTSSRCSCRRISPR